jgi:hypothetical protein
LARHPLLLLLLLLLMALPISRFTRLGGDKDSQPPFVHGSAQPLCRLCAVTLTFGQLLR